jgi:hypothetical protein
MKPHATQIVSIMRLLGLDSLNGTVRDMYRRVFNVKTPLENHLIEIKTGEG